MIYAVIDTNVFVSALLSHHPDAATVQVVEAISQKGLCPLYNEEIMAEYEEVLGRTKFRFPAPSIYAIINKVKKTGILTKGIPSSEHFPEPYISHQQSRAKQDNMGCVAKATSAGNWYQ